MITSESLSLSIQGSRGNGLTQGHTSWRQRLCSKQCAFPAFILQLGPGSSTLSKEG